MSTRRRSRSILAAPIAVAAVLAFSASAAAQTWTAAVNTNWNTAGNWTPASVPNSATADVSLGFTGAGIVNISTTVQARSVTFDSVAGGAYTLTSAAGQVLTGVSAINLTGPISNVQTINLANVAGGSLVFPGTGAAALAITNNADPSATPTLTIGPNTVIGTAGGGGITIGGTGRTIVSGSISATQPVTGGLTKAGPGVLVLNGNGTNLGGGVSLNNGTLGLDFSSITAIKFANASALLSAGGDIDLVAHATTAVTQNTGGTTLAAGHTQINRSGGGAAVTYGAGGFTRSPTTTFDALVIGGGTLTVSTSTGTVNGLLGTGPAFATVNGALWAGVSGGQLAGNPGMAGIFGAGVNTLISANTSVPTVTTNSLRFDTGSPTVTLTGTLTLQSGGILTANTASSPTIMGGSVATAGEMLIHQYSNGTVTINSPISAPTALTKTGPGLLSLGGTVTTGGPINVNRGGLQITSLTAVSSSSGINFNDNRTGGSGLQQFIVQLPDGMNGTISRPIRLSAHSFGSSFANVFSTGTSLNSLITLSGVISSAPGSVTPIRFTGAADDSSGFRLTGVNTFTGDVQLLGGTLSVFANASLGNAGNSLILAVGSATTGGLEFTSDGANLTRPVSITAVSRVISNTGQSNTISGPVTGSTLVKAGNGTLVLTNAGNAGTRDIQAGTLAVNAAGLGTAGDFHVSDGATLAITATATLDSTRTVAFGSGLVSNGSAFARGMIDVSAGQTFTIAGLVSEFTNSAPGTLIKTGPGILVLTRTNNLYTGGTVVRAGDLRAQGDGSLGPEGPVTVEPLGTLSFTGSTTTARAFNLTAGTLAVSTGQTLTFNNATVGGGFLRGAGSYALAGDTALSGVTTLTSTTISQTGPASVANFTNGGSFTVGAGQTLAWNGGTNTSSGQMFVNGTANVSDFVSNGQVTIPNGGVMNNSGAPLVLGGGSRTSIGLAAVPGGAINLGGQTLELNGGLLVNNGTVNGTVNVNFGSVAKGAGQYGVVNVGDGGVYAPGNSPGISTAAAVDFDDTPTIFGGPTLMIELAGIAPGTEYDQLHVTGSLSLGGKLAVSLVNGFAPQAGNSFDILDWGTISGAFGTVNLPTLSGTLTWDTSRLPTTGELIVIPEPGSAVLLPLGALVLAARRRVPIEAAA